MQDGQNDVRDIYLFLLIIMYFYDISFISASVPHMLLQSCLMCVLFSNVFLHLFA